MVKLVRADAIDLLQSLDDHSVKAIIQDPPYNTYGKTSKAHEYDWFMPANTGFNFNEKYWEKFMKEAKRVLKKDGFLASTFSYQKLHYLLSPADKLGFHVRRVIVLINMHSGGAIMYSILPTVTIFVPILSIQPKSKMYVERLKKYFENGEMTNVWYIPGKDINIRFPGAQPLLPFIMLVEMLTDEGDLVVDPFVGSGTTAEACILLNRQFIGGDINKESIERAKIRLSGYLK